MRLFIKLAKNSLFTKLISFTHMKAIFSNEFDSSYINPSYDVDIPFVDQVIHQSSCYLTDVYLPSPSIHDILLSGQVNYENISTNVPTSIFNPKLPLPPCTRTHLTLIESEEIASYKTSENYHNATQQEILFRSVTSPVIVCSNDTTYEVLMQPFYGNKKLQVNLSHSNREIHHESSFDRPKSSSCIYQASKKPCVYNNSDHIQYEDSLVIRPNYDTSDILNNSLDTLRNFDNVDVRIPMEKHNTTYCTKRKYVDHVSSVAHQYIFPTYEPTDHKSTGGNIKTCNTDNLTTNQSKYTSSNSSIYHNSCGSYVEGDFLKNLQPLNLPTPLDNLDNSPDSAIKNPINVPQHDSCFLLCIGPKYNPYNTETDSLNSYNPSTYTNQYGETLIMPMLDINTASQKETYVSSMKDVMYYRNMPNCGTIEENPGRGTDDISFPLKKTKRQTHTTKEPSNIEIPPDTYYPGSKTSLECKFSLNGKLISYKCESELDMETTIILDCCTQGTPKYMDITYEDFTKKYIYHRLGISKLSFSYTIPIVTTINFRTQGNLKYFKVNFTLKKDEIHQVIYGVAYFTDDLRQDRDSEQLNIVLENTIPTDLSILIKTLYEFKFPVYNFHDVNYHEVISFKRCIAKPSTHTMSISDFFAKFHEEDIFAEYPTIYKCKYNSIMDIPIRNKYNRYKSPQIDWKSSIYVVYVTTVAIFADLKKIEEVMANTNITHVYMKQEVNQYIKNIIEHIKPMWEIKYDIKRDNNHDKEVLISCFYIFLNQKVKRVLEHWNKNIFTGEVIEFITNEHGYLSIY